MKKEVVFSFFLRRAAKGARTAKHSASQVLWRQMNISGGPSLWARTPRAWVSGALTVILDR